MVRNRPGASPGMFEARHNNAWRMHRARLYTDPHDLPFGSQNGIVIGNDMARRVHPTAKALGAGAFPGDSERSVGEFARNILWMIQECWTREWILDIGPNPGTKPMGIYYRMERFIARVLCKKA